MRDKDFPFLHVNFGVQFTFQRVSFVANTVVGWIYPSLVTLVEPLGILVHELIKLVKIDIRQYWTDDSTLRCSRISMIELPVFYISGFKELSNQANKANIVYSFFKYAYQYAMVYVVEESFNVSLDEPFSPDKPF